MNGSVPHNRIFLHGPGFLLHIVRLRFASVFALLPSSLNYDAASRCHKNAVSGVCREFVLGRDASSTLRSSATEDGPRRPAGISARCPYHFRLRGTITVPIRVIRLHSVPPRQVALK